MPTKPILPFHDLDQRHAGLTPSIASSYAEAARVCLDRHHHSPTDFDVDRSPSRSAVIVEWVSSDTKEQNAWANATDATEAGACACALAAVELTYDLVAVRRAETMSGADYYVARPGDPAEDLEGCLRLEVSGVDHGPEGVIRKRLRAKMAQAEAGKSNLPALAGVVGFRARLIMLAKLEA